MYNPYNTYPYSSSNPNPDQPVQKSLGKRKLWISGTIGAALITALASIIVALITISHPAPSSTPTPQPTLSSTSIPQVQVPQLHPSYNGGLNVIFNGAIIQRIPLSITSLSEDNSGNFTARGTVGLCNAHFSGNADSSHAIHFTGFEEINSFTGCNGFTGTFTGQASGNGDSLSGNWVVSSTGESGTWNAS